MTSQAMKLVLKKYKQLKIMKINHYLLESLK